jgi:hypothetical protein
MPSFFFCAPIATSAVCLPPYPPSPLPPTYPGVGLLPRPLLSLRSLYLSMSNYFSLTDRHTHTPVSLSLSLAHFLARSRIHTCMHACIHAYKAMYDKSILLHPLELILVHTLLCSFQYIHFCTNFATRSRHAKRCTTHRLRGAAFFYR